MRGNAILQFRLLYARHVGQVSRSAISLLFRQAGKPAPRKTATVLNSGCETLGLFKYKSMEQIT